MTGTQPTNLVSPRLAPGTETNRPPASVVIRNRNERQHLERLLRVLDQQTVRPEVVVVDNESSDGSTEIATGNGARVVHLAKSQFTYGHAINVGVASAAADIIVMLSSHSLPLGSRFIENCLKPFVDPKVAAVRCLQLQLKINGQFKDAFLDALESLQVEFREGWLNARMIEGPREPVRWDNWSTRLSDLPENNGCAFRKAVWRDIPFDEQIEFAEDRVWSYHVLNAGYRIATASAWYEYFRTETGFWPSLRRYRRQETALYQMIGERQPIGHIARKMVLTVPRAVATTSLRLIAESVIAAIVPLYAGRAPKRGSVR